MRRGNHFRHGGHSHQVCADRPQIANLRRRFVTRAGQRRVHALRQLDAQPLPFLQRRLLVRLPVHLRQVGKAHAEAVFVRADQGIDALQIDMVAQNDQASLLEIAIDSARGIGEEHRANSHSRHHAHRKNHLLRRVAFIEMHAALHHRHRRVRHFADHHAPRVADRGGPRKIRDFLVVNARGAREFIRKRAQSAAEHQADARAKLGFRQDEFRGALGAQKFLAWFGLCRSGCAHFRKIPTIEADIRFAMVPASMARMPNFASCDF